jgi:signal peptidase I
LRHTLLIKRVSGVPGDRVAITRGRVAVNGTPLDAPHLDGGHGRRRTSPGRHAGHPQPGTCACAGTLRPASVDSRKWGFLDINTMIGQAVFGSWPPDTWGRVSG